MGKVIEVNDLSFGYGERLIFKNVGFSVEKGFCRNYRSNGSGKSTLIKLLLRQLKPIKGQIKLLGQDIEKFDQWNKIGYVAQKANSFNTSFPATVEEVVSANLFPKSDFSKG